MQNIAFDFIKYFCPVCGSGDGVTLFEGIRRAPMYSSGYYVKCCVCDMVYLSYIPDKNVSKKCYDFLSDFYSGISRQANTPISEMKGPLSWLYNFIFRFQPHSLPFESGDGRKLLDIGCGNAVKLREFSERDWQIFGVDVSAKAIEAARKNIPNGNFWIGEVGDIELPKNYFDIIRMDNLLEHVPEPELLLRHCHNLLNRRGILIVYVPHGQSLSIRLLGKYAYSALVPLHINLFSVPTLERILKNAGFSSVSIQQFCPHSWIPGGIKLLLGIEHINWSVWFDRFLMLMLLPVGLLASGLGCGEELVAIAER